MEPSSGSSNATSGWLARKRFAPAANTSLVARKLEIGGRFVTAGDGDERQENTVPILRSMAFTPE